MKSKKLKTINKAYPETKIKKFAKMLKKQQKGWKKINKSKKLKDVVYVSKVDGKTYKISRGNLRGRRHNDRRDLHPKHPLLLDQIDARLPVRDLRRPGWRSDRLRYGGLHLRRLPLRLLFYPDQSAIAFIIFFYITAAKPLVIQIAHRSHITGIPSFG